MIGRMLVGLALVGLALGGRARADWSELGGSERCGDAAESLRGGMQNDWPTDELLRLAQRCADSASALTTLAELFAARRDYSDAKTMLDTAGQLPTAARLGRYHFWRGYLLASAGEFAQSLAAYRRARQSPELGVEPWLLEYNSADDLMALGRLEEAAATYRRAVKLSDSRAIHLALAVALDRLGDSDGARAELALLVRGERRPDRIWPAYMVLFPQEEEHLYRALLFRHLGRQREAVDELQKFIEKGKASPYLRHAQMRLSAWTN